MLLVLFLVKMLTSITRTDLMKWLPGIFHESNLAEATFNFYHPSEQCRYTEGRSKEIGRKIKSLAEGIYDAIMFVLGFTVVSRKSAHLRKSAHPLLFAQFPVQGQSLLE